MSTRCKGVIFFKILIILFVFLLEGCQLHKQKKRSVFVLFDVSGSTIDLRKQFYDIFQNKVFEKLKGGDRIIAGYITENPLTQSEFPINEEIPKYNPLKDSKMTYDRKVKNIKEATLKKAKGMISSVREKRGSNILDSMRLAERVFKTYKKDKKILVIFSDMIEQSKEYDFTGMKLTEKEINRIIANERARGLPNLQGVKVYVSGATADHYGGISTEKILSIQEFWLIYFKECGAELVEYGGTLLSGI